MQRRLKDDGSLQIRLREAAQEIILEQGTKALSVASIARCAGINRTTFYLIYSSKDELLRDLCDHFLTGHLEQFMKSQNETPDEQRNTVIRSFNALSKEERLLRAIWSIESETLHPYRTMEESIYNIIYKDITEKYGAIASPCSIELFARYYAANTMVLVRWWLDNHTKVSPEYPYQIIMTCLNQGMLRMLDIKE